MEGLCFFRHQYLFTSPVIPKLMLLIGVCAVRFRFVFWRFCWLHWKAFVIHFNCVRHYFFYSRLVALIVAICAGTFCVNYPQLVFSGIILSCSGSVSPSTSSRFFSCQFCLFQGFGVAECVIIHSTLRVVLPFFRVLALLRVLLEGRGFLSMTQAEVQEWSDAPEQYYLLQDSLDASESIRVRDVPFGCRRRDWWQTPQITRVPPTAQ